ncbi:hypothetical protein, partial [Streptomyces avidinii]
MPVSSEYQAPTTARAPFFTRGARPALARNSSAATRICGWFMVSETGSAPGLATVESMQGSTTPNGS